MIAVGIPTVIGAAAIVHDTVKAMIQALLREKQTEDYGAYMEKISSEEQYQLIPGAFGAGVRPYVCHSPGYRRESEAAELHCLRGNPPGALQRRDKQVKILPGLWISLRAGFARREQKSRFPA